MRPIKCFVFHTIPELGKIMAKIIDKKKIDLSRARYIDWLRWRAMTGRRCKTPVKGVWSSNQKYTHTSASCYIYTHQEYSVIFPMVGCASNCSNLRNHWQYHCTSSWTCCRLKASLTTRAKVYVDWSQSSKVVELTARLRHPRQDHRYHALVLPLQAMHKRW